MATLEIPFEKVRRKMVEARVEFMGQLAKFSAGELAMQPGEDEWSPLRLAHHLYIADGLALEQMQTVQNEDNPLLTAADEEAPRRTRASKPPASLDARSEEHTSELQSHLNLVCRLLLEKKKKSETDSQQTRRY